MSIFESENTTALQTRYDSWAATYDADHDDWGWSAPTIRHPLAILEPSPTGQSCGPGDLLDAKHVGTALRQPLGERLEHGTAPCVHRDDLHDLTPAWRPRHVSRRSPQESRSR